MGRCAAPKPPRCAMTTCTPIALNYVNTEREVYGRRDVRMVICEYVREDNDNDNDNDNDSDNMKSLLFWACSRKGINGSCYYDNLLYAIGFLQLSWSELSSTHRGIPWSVAAEVLRVWPMSMKEQFFLLFCPSVACIYGKKVVNLPSTYYPIYGNKQQRAGRPNIHRAQCRDRRQKNWFEVHLSIKNIDRQKNELLLSLAQRDLNHILTVMRNSNRTVARAWLRKLNMDLHWIHLWWRKLPLRSIWLLISLLDITAEELKRADRNLWVAFALAARHPQRLYLRSYIRTQTRTLRLCFAT